MEAKVFKPSKYQQAVYDFIEKGNGNAVIDAVAGSGKSTTIVTALKLVPKSKTALFLAFNKAIIKELKEKIGEQSNVEVKTLHSLGCNAVLRHLKLTFNNIDENKYYTHINNAMKYDAIKPTYRLEDDDIADYKSNIVKLTDLGRSYLCSSVAELEQIAIKHSIVVIDNECDMAMKTIDWGRNEVGSIDFTDMIYFPNVKKIPIWQYDYVFIDECQDLNTAQRELFLKCLKPNGRFIAVGDPRQAIYGFAGADIESFEKLKNLNNTTLLPLSVCYRCDADIIGMAKSIVPQIEAKDNAPNGIVDLEAKLADIQDSDMVLCRITAPLVKLCMQYIGQGVKAYVKGRDIGTNLINMIRKTDETTIEKVIIRLNSEAEKIVRKVMRKTHCSDAEARQTNAFTSYNDKINAIIVLSEGLNNADSVCNRIETIFKDDQRNGICLSTIHKAKGLEANNVYIICEEKFYLKHCMKVQWMAEQERNLVYVAYTRAKHKLGFVIDFKCD